METLTTLEPRDLIAPNLRAQEVFDFNDLEPTLDMIHPQTLELWTKVRRAWGKPIRVSSGVRTEERQEWLRQAGYPAATTSPHVVRLGACGKVIRPGTALDLDTNSRDETVELAELIRQLSPIARLGYKRYLRLGYTFVHMDLAPLLFEAPGPEAYLAPKETTLPRPWKYHGLVF